MPDVIVTWAGFVLTLMVFSYLLGDNFLYRLAVFAFVGLTAGFVTMITVESILLPWLRLALESQDVGVQTFGLIPFVLGFALILKVSRRFGALGNLGLALIVGVGAAVAVVGAISGTLLLLSSGVSGAIAAGVAESGGGATADSTRIFNAFLIVVGVVCTLASFQYAARRIPGASVLNAAGVDEAGRGSRRGLLIRAMSAVGQGFIVVTLGAIYGGAILSGLTIFSERIAFLLARISGG